MPEQTTMQAAPLSTEAARAALLAGLPVTEQRYDLAGISTSVLEGGDGPPLILLHGPGETGLWWMRALPELVQDFHVIAPDLPGHGASRVVPGDLDPERVYDWLDALIDTTAQAPPVLVGHIFGGAIAARYAARRRRRLGRLILVNTLGLRRLRPKPGFVFGLMRVMVRPNERNHDRFMAQCMFDPEDLAVQMGDKWPAFVAYNLAMMRDPDAKAGMGALMKHFGMPRIPSEELEALPRSTGLIWGREDRATPVRVAEQASARRGWPLHAIERARDDPKLERPAEFVAALCALARPQDDERDHA